MKRPFGVTASAVFVLLGSLLMVAFFVLVGITTLMSSATAMPPEAKLALPMAVAMFGLLSAWGITTAIGLFRVRNWARISIVVFSVCICFGGLITGPTMLVIPAPSGAGESFHTIMKVMALAYGALGLLGAFWLYYFNRGATREVFRGTTYSESARPLSVSIIGWWLLAAGLLAPIGALTKMPTVLLAWVVTGWAAVALNVAYGALGVWLGYGLLRLTPVARIAAISWFCFAAVNSLVFYLVPGRDARFASLMSGYSFGSQPPPIPTQFPTAFILPLTLIMLAAPIWFLNAAKRSFDPIMTPEA